MDYAWTKDLQDRARNLKRKEEDETPHAQCNAFEYRHLEPKDGMLQRAQAFFLPNGSTFRAPKQGKGSSADAAPCVGRMVEGVAKGTAGGSEGIARRVRERYLRAGVEQPAVEIRLHDVTAMCQLSTAAARGHLSIGSALQEATENVAAKLACRQVPKHEVTLLCKVSAPLRAGRMTLVLGPSNAGKSLLLQLMAGVPCPGIEMKGDITYNGTTAGPEFCVQRTVRYVGAEDASSSQLTVRETLIFSSMVQGPRFSPELLQRLHAAEAERELDVDDEVAGLMSAMASRTHPNADAALFLQLLSLAHKADTPVSSLSSAEARRLSVGENVIGPSNVLFMDDIDKGCDLGAALQIAHTLRALSHLRRATVAVALREPVPELYGVFDDLLLLARGHLVYAGPCDVLDHFKALGFEPGGGSTTAAFLQEVLSEREQRALVTDGCKCHKDSRGFVPPAALAAAFHDSEAGKEMHRALEAPHGSAHSRDALLADCWGTSHWQAVKALFWREQCDLTHNVAAAAVVHRESHDANEPVETRLTAPVRSTRLQARSFRMLLVRWCALFIKVFVLGTAFLGDRVDTLGSIGAAGNVYSVLFYSCILPMLANLPQAGKMVGRLPLFWNQSYHKRFFPGWAYAIPLAFLGLPVFLFESLVWVAVLYVMVDIGGAWHHFLCLWAIIAALQAASESAFRAIGAVARASVVANFATYLWVVLNITASNKPLLFTQMPSYWRWCVWILPLFYSTTGAGNNEFLLRRWADSGDLDPSIAPSGVGRKFMQTVDLHIGSQWRWIPPLALMGFWVFANISTAAALTWGRPPSVRPSRPPGDCEAHGDASTPLGALSLEAGPETLQHEQRTTDTSPNTSSDEEKGSVEPGRSDREVSRVTMVDNRAVRTLPTVCRRLVRLNGTCGGTACDAENRSRCTADSQMQSNSHKFTNVLKFVLFGGGKDCGDAAQTGSFRIMPITVTLQNLCYTFEGDKAGAADNEILSGLSAVFRPGTITAVLGHIASGREAVLDVLGGQMKQGTRTGSFMINGRDVDHRDCVYTFGICSQQDAHVGSATIEESLRMTLQLRHGGLLSPEQVNERVDHALGMTELRCLRDRIVGAPGSHGLAQKDFARFVIATELVSNPSVLLCRSPTVGLEVSAALGVMRALRAAADAGTTVIVTLQSGPARVYAHLDAALVVQHHKPIYFGPAGDAVQYLHDVSGVPRSDRRGNPALHVLAMTDPQSEQYPHRDYPSLYEQRLRAHVEREVAEACEQSKHHFAGSTNPGQGKAGLLKQYRILFARHARAYWRNPAVNLSRLITALFAAFLLGTWFWNQNDNLSSQAQLRPPLGLLFLSTIVIAFVNMLSFVPILFEERAAFKREHQRGMYSSLVWASALMDVEALMVVIQVNLYALPTYFMVQYEADVEKLVIFVLFITLSSWAMCYLGAFSMLAMPTAAIGSAFASTIASFWLLFSGFLIARPVMPPWWRWLWYSSPTAWAIYAAFVAQLGDNVRSGTEIEVVNEEGRKATSTIAQYVKESFGYSYSSRWPAIAATFGSVLVLRMLALLALKLRHR